MCIKPTKNKISITSGSQESS
jgi:hypothetical protein